MYLLREGLPGRDGRGRARRGRPAGTDAAGRHGILRPVGGLRIGLAYDLLGSWPSPPEDPADVDVGFNDAPSTMQAFCEGGFAISQYVLDTPHGKVPLTHPQLRGREGDDVVVESWDGHLWREPNPLER